MPKGQAILVGLNSVNPAHYDGWSGPLNACEADADSMADIAASEKLATTKLLTKRATRANLTNALKKAAKELRDGDLLLLTYSGHGGQVPDRNSDEDDRMDETWCLFDGQILDDEMSSLYAQFKKGVQIFVLSDSCHSGTVTKVALARGIMSLTSAGMPVEYRNMPIEIAGRTYQKNKKFYNSIQDKTKPKSRADVACSVLLISGCQDNQLSADGAFNGLFTATLLQVWNGGQFKGSYADLHKRIRRMMPPDQSPNLYWGSRPNEKFLDHRPFTINNSSPSRRRK